MVEGWVDQVAYDGRSSCSYSRSFAGWRNGRPSSGLGRCLRFCTTSDLTCPLPAAKSLCCKKWRFCR